MVRRLTIRTNSISNSADHVNKRITAAGIINAALVTATVEIAHVADSDAQTCGVKIVNSAAIVVI